MSWQAVSVLYKVCIARHWTAFSLINSALQIVSRQFRTDAQLIELVDKMRLAFTFSREARSLDDKAEMLKPLLKELLYETAECSRFVQEYCEHSFSGTIVPLPAFRFIDTDLRPQVGWVG